MGKSDEKQTKQRAHKATDGESKCHKPVTSFDATNFEAADADEGARNSQWLDRFRQLCEFKVEFGHCRVPNRYNPTLGAWFSYQRKSPMTPEHIRALNGIGFEWGTSKIELASIWTVRFQQLCEFKAQFGDCLVPRKYSANPKLGRWVKNQRYRYRLHQEGKPSSCMTPERIPALESVGALQAWPRETWDSIQGTWTSHQSSHQQEQQYQGIVHESDSGLGLVANSKLKDFVSAQDVEAASSAENA
jgi:hypothetical protein